ncbi:MAG: hypothetical protein FJ276_14570 [Planctomycetes bacterium]|nr:hypothetical protein [Planctomycetota bacterium]
MPGVIDSLSTLNSIVRTALAVIAVGLLGFGSYYGYRVLNADSMALKEKEEQLVSMQSQLEVKGRELRQMEQLVRDQTLELERRNLQIQKLETSLRLMKVNHRVAWLTVLDQSVEVESGDLYTTVQFVEVNDKGEAIEAPKEIRIKGDVVYLDNWVVKFEDKYIEHADIDRSTSLVLFRRIFGESQTPRDGVPIDSEGSRPRAYGDGKQVSDFERRIWSEFWTIANDEAKAKELGIRAAHGEAPSMKVRMGKSYKVMLRAADGLSITPDSAPPPVVGKPAA